MNPAYLIVLEGQGDTVVSVVDQETWDWINSPVPEFAKEESGWDEIDIAPTKLQQVIRDGKYGDDGIQVTIGSYDNDRAMALCDGGCLFHIFGNEDAIDVARAWTGRNKYEIVDIYEGFIY